MPPAQPSGTCCSDVRFFCLLSAFSRIFLLSYRITMRVAFALGWRSKEFSPWDTLPTKCYLFIKIKFQDCKSVVLL